MNKIFLQKTEGQRFSRAEIYLANRMRTLRAVYKNEEDFVRHMTVEVDGISFIKSEARRLYKAMKTVRFYDNGTCLTGIDQNGKLCFRRELAVAGSNFFEEYAHALLEEGEVIQPRGRKLGFKPSKKSVMEAQQEELSFEITPVEEEEIVASSPLHDIPTEELINELLSRANILSVRVEYGQTI